MQYMFHRSSHHVNDGPFILFVYLSKKRIGQIRRSGERRRRSSSIPSSRTVEEQLPHITTNTPVAMEPLPEIAAPVEQL